MNLQVEEAEKGREILKGWFQEDLSRKKEELDATHNEINKPKEKENLQVMDRIDKELEKRTGKTTIDEGTNSITSHSEIDKIIEQNKDIITLKNDAKLVNDNGKKTTPPLKNNNSSSYVHSLMVIDFHVITLDNRLGIVNLLTCTIMKDHCL